MVETRKLAAILAADVVGFSRLASADEERTLARLRAHRSDLIDPTIALHREAEAMSDQNRDELSDKEKIDRAAYHEEVRFLKKQQWAVATAGVLLFGALLAAIRDMPTATALDRLLAVVLVAAGVYGGCFFLDDLQDGLAKVRRALDPNDHDAATRGVGVVRLFKSILVVSAVVVVWAVVFKLPIRR